MYDIENPWINKLNLNISSITPVCENYITLLEKESGINFERLYNAINIELTGYLNHPTIKGFTIINQ